jgi:hypothetical protein
MKKLYLTFAACLIAVISFANPVFTGPPFALNKFYFDNNQNWKIIFMGNGYPDSVLVCSSSGKSICEKYKYPFDTNCLKLYQCFFCFQYLCYNIVNDSLKSNVNINPQGDSLTLIYYYNKSSTTETIVFGNYRNSIIPAPLKGQSIVTFLIYTQTQPQVIFHCLSNSSGHTQGTIYGHIYDKNNNLITKGTIALNPFFTEVDCEWSVARGADGIVINSDGTYSSKLYSLSYNIASIHSCVPWECGGNYYWETGTASITPLKFTIEPDTSINIDIHLSGDFVGIKNVTANSIELLKVFPHPINSYSFHYEISTPVKSTNCYIDLINTNGQEIERYNIYENTGELNLPANISNGTYILQLRMNEKVYSSTKIMVILK